jgi:hypothetical protein
MPAMKSFLRSSPEFEGPVLNELAASPRNAGLVLALWSGQPLGNGPDWRERLVSGLVGAGQFGKAFAIWKRLSSVEAQPGALYNPEFRRGLGPPPFNWSFTAKGGVAEARSEGGLQVIYYGREDAVLAQQTSPQALLPACPRLAGECAACLARG